MFVPPECAKFPVIASVPPPSTETTPKPVTLPAYPEASERLKSSTVNGSRKVLPASAPVVPPLPICSVPPLTMLPPSAVFAPVRMSVPPPCFRRRSCLTPPFCRTPAKVFVPDARFTVSVEVSTVPPFSITGDPGTAFVESPVKIGSRLKSCSFVPGATPAPKLSVFCVPSAVEMPSLMTPPLITTPPVKSFALLIVSVPVPLFTRFVEPLILLLPCSV